VTYRLPEAEASNGINFSGRSSGSRLERNLAPSHVNHAVDSQISRRIQQRSCAGFTPASLFISNSMETPEGRSIGIKSPSCHTSSEKVTKKRSHRHHRNSKKVVTGPASQYRSGSHTKSNAVNPTRWLSRSGEMPLPTSTSRL